MCDSILSSTINALFAFEQYALSAYMPRTIFLPTRRRFRYPEKTSRVETSSQAGARQGYSPPTTHARINFAHRPTMGFVLKPKENSTNLPVVFPVQRASVSFCAALFGSFGHISRADFSALIAAFSAAVLCYFEHAMTEASAIQSSSSS